MVPVLYSRWLAGHHQDSIGDQGYARRTQGDEPGFLYSSPTGITFRKTGLSKEALYWPWDYKANQEITLDWESLKVYTIVVPDQYLPRASSSFPPLIVRESRGTVYECPL